MNYLKNFTYPFYLAIALFSLQACDDHPGFSKTTSGIYKKMEQFGDCKPAMTDADYFIMDITFISNEKPDTGYHFQLHHHALREQTPSEKKGELPGLRLIHELDSLQCGDRISYIIPFSEVDRCFLSAFADSNTYRMDEEITFTVHLQKTFDKQGYIDYLMHASQQYELGEAEAIELLLMNDPKRGYEKHGDCFIQFLHDVPTDSILNGREIKISYNTLLFNGRELDHTTEMQFNFGKPGQIIAGLQYALTFLTEDDHALIYLPSYLAFGEKGNSNGIVPPHTPIVFDVNVLEVKTKEEISTR